MNTPINDGGPAFPGEAGEDGYGFYKKQFGPNGEQNWLALNQGMSLRDWFAGQALAGLCANPALFSSFQTVRSEMLKVMSAEECDSFEHKCFSMSATFIGDAMLTARNTQPSK